MVGFQVSKAHAKARVSRPMQQDALLSCFSGSTLVCHHAPTMTKPQTLSKIPVKHFLFQIALVMVSLYRNVRVTKTESHIAKPCGPDLLLLHLNPTCWDCRYALPHQSQIPQNFLSTKISLPTPEPLQSFPELGGISSIILHHPQSLTAKRVLRHYQMSPGDKITICCESLL